jgi:hypothetical protein
MDFITKIERKIKSKMKLIKSEELTPRESKIGVLFTALKQKDEVSYNELMIQYKKILNEI